MKKTIWTKLFVFAFVVEGSIACNSNDCFTSNNDSTLDAAIDTVINGDSGDAPSINPDAANPDSTPSDIGLLTTTWARFERGYGGDYGQGIALDKSGNIYVTGFYSQETVFGTFTLPQTSGYDFFLAKYDPNGDVIWAKAASGSGDDSGQSIALDSSGKIYVAGGFGTKLNFGTTTLTASSLSSDIFIAKFDTDGSLTWAKSVKAPSHTGKGNKATSLTVDPLDNICVTGFFKGQAVFDSTTLSSSSHDIFLAKYMTDGTLLWVKSAGGPGEDMAYGVAVNHIKDTEARRSIYVTGEFKSTAIFGSTIITGGDYSNTFIAKYDSTGEVKWAKALGGYSSNMGMSIKVGLSENLYVTGAFGAKIEIGTTTLTTLAPLDFDMFVAKFLPSGEPLWAKSAGGPKGLVFGGLKYADQGNSIVVDAAENVFVTGYFTDRAVFDNTTVWSNMPWSGDIFVTKYDTNGKVLWVETAGGPEWDEGLDLTLDSHNNAYVTGYFGGLGTFGGITLSSEYGTLDRDIFVWKLGMP